MRLKEIAISIQRYTDRLQANPAEKGTPLHLPAGTVPLEGFARIAAKKAEQTDDPFALFSIAKHGFALCTASGDYQSLARFFPQWLYVCLNVGAYEDCIVFSQLCTTSPHWISLGHKREGVALLRSYAKALRNLGQFEQSLSKYRASIERASSLGLRVDEGIGLLLIGKLYGNYLGQQSLFSAFVEEARLLLESSLQSADVTESTRITRHLAICHDALGQVHRETDASLARRHFVEAIRLNRRIKRNAGVSRSVCHLNYFRFMADPQDVKALQWFRYGIRLLQDDTLEERGLGVRWIQYAAMLNEIGDSGGAEECLAEGKRIAARFSDHKSIVRGCLVEAKICWEMDPRRALTVLMAGREIAERFNLLLNESIINRELARLPIRGFPAGLEPVRLFERNREIHLRHIEEVKANLEHLRSATQEQQEFRFFSRRTREDFRQQLLLDFERIVGELDLNIRGLTGALRRSEDVRQELLVLGVVNSVARELLHEIKISIPVDVQENLFESIAGELEEVAAELRSATESQLIGKVLQFSSRVEIQATRVRSLEKKMVRLKAYLSTQLRRPMLTDKVSLEWVCRRAIEELAEQLGDASTLTLALSWDLEMTSSKDLLVLVVKNLLRNAIEDIQGRGQIGREGIRLSLDLANPCDIAPENPARSIVFSIMSCVGSETVARNVAEALQMGLLGYPSTKAFGSGVGLDLARMVLGALMGASLKGVASGREAGIRIEFPPGTGRIRPASVKEWS